VHQEIQVQWQFNFAKKMGARVIAISKDNWIKTDFGADYIISDYDKVVEQVKDITQGKMADVVLNSLGVNTWEIAFHVLVLMAGG
jgi:NADPH:quinone reductase-like Zn-dependent oxidoreductase